MTEDKGFSDRNIRFQEVIMAKINIDPNKPVGTISPHIYGHFTDHIGGVMMASGSVRIRQYQMSTVSDYL